MTLTQSMTLLFFNNILFPQNHNLNIFHGNDKEPHPFHVKSDWDPPVQPSVALETFLEEVKFDLASIKLNRPKDNLSLGERNALKELSRDKNIVLEKADKGTTTVIMNKEDNLTRVKFNLMIYTTTGP